MAHSWYFRSYLHLILFASAMFLLIGCIMSTPQSGLVDSNIVPTTTQLATVMLGQTVVTTDDFTPTPTIENTKSHETPMATYTNRSLATTTPEFSPSPTPALTATPDIQTIVCDSANALPAEAFPTQVEMERSRVVIAEPYLYLAVEQYIGVFDISVPNAAQFWGFWDFPALSEISDFKVQNDIAYVASGSALELLSLAPQCRFASILRMDLPFQIFRLQVEGDRLYVGGYSADDQHLHVTILSLSLPSQPENLGSVDLERAIWSVHNEKLYSLVLGDLEKLLVTDLTDPTSPHTEPLNINVEPQLLAQSLTRFVNDTLYLLSERDGVFIVKDLQAETPVVHHGPVKYPFIKVFQVQDNYIFLGDNWCDAGCSSKVWILDAENGTELSSLGLHPYYPVWRYVEIRKSIIYAFSNDALLMIDISDMTHPIIIDKVSMIP